MDILIRPQSFNLTAIATVVGLLMLVYGVVRLCWEIVHRPYMRETPGTLAGWKDKNDAIVSFRAESGIQYKVTTTVLTSARASMRVGGPFPLPVVYDVRRPALAAIGRTAYFWIAALLWIALGVAALYFSAGGGGGGGDGGGVFGRARDRIARFDENDALLGFGAILAIVGVGTLVSRIFFVLHSHTTTGKLVGWHERKAFVGHRSRMTTFYHAIVAYSAGDGVTHQVVSGGGTGAKPSLPMGHPYPVRYDPRNPADALIATPWELWGMPILCMVFGGGLLSLVG